MRWSEQIVIGRPLTVVHAAIADAYQLIHWSAWRQVNGYLCRVDGDGTSVGSVIVFEDVTGVECGRQTLTCVEPDRVEYRMRNRGPAGRDIAPEVDFLLSECSDGTLVVLDFRVEVPLPFALRHVVETTVGRRIRALHICELCQLKAHVEACSAT